MRTRNVSNAKTSFADRAGSPHDGGTARESRHILQEHAMWINTPNARLDVVGHRSLRLEDARGTRLRAVRGTLWVTLDADPRDIVLSAGEAFTVDTDERVVVTSLGECATLDVRSAQRAPRLWARLRSLWPARGAAVLRALPA